jgi:hypothetical protein
MSARDPEQLRRMRLRYRYVKALLGDEPIEERTIPVEPVAIVERLSRPCLSPEAKTAAARASSAKWHAANKAAVKDYKARWYAKHRVRLLARLRAKGRAARAAEAARYYLPAQAGFQFAPDGWCERVAVVAADQHERASATRVLDALVPLHPAVRKLCLGVIDGADLSEAAADAGLDDGQLARVLPPLRAYLAPHVGRAA